MRIHGTGIMPAQPGSRAVGCAVLRLPCLHGGRSHILSGVNLSRMGLGGPIKNKHCDYFDYTDDTIIDKYGCCTLL